MPKRKHEDIELDPEPNPVDEEKSLWIYPKPNPLDEDEIFQVYKSIKIKSEAHELEIKKDYAQSAKAIALLWLLFIFTVVLAEYYMSLKGMEGLDSSVLIALIVSTTAPVFGLFWQVGRSIYPANPKRNSGDAG